MERNLFLNKAVHNNKPASGKGILERLFTFAFRGFVYPQIWEDPEVDLSALQINQNSRILTIASGGCNVMNYLTEAPAHIDAVDLNPAHVALTRLKLTALKHLPDYESFLLFFGHAKSKSNIDLYYQYIEPHLDDFTRRYWSQWSLIRGKRINYFKENIYQFGLLGRFISAVHILAGLYGKDPGKILNAKTMEQQKEIFERELAPLFNKRLVRFLCNLPVSLYGLGIPPSQFDALRGDKKTNMADVLKKRLEKLACGFSIQENYFAWQAFGRGYDLENQKALPRYLKEKQYETLKKYVDHAAVHHDVLTDFLSLRPSGQYDCYVLLDAQDWMSPVNVAALWQQISRTARPGARVIFRTAGQDSPLEEKLPATILDRWYYNSGVSTEAIKKDRSAIYGGFHVYTLAETAPLKKAV